MSAGFISDVMRGVKRPGPEFLLALRMSLGVSVDWLLSGQGTMTGGSGIRQDLLQTIRIQVAVARAAVLTGDATAKALLTLVQEGRLDLTANVDAFRELLDKVAPPDEDLELVIQLYNGQQWASDPISQRRNLVSAAISHFEAKKPFDRLAAISGEAPLSGVTQVITGSGHRIAAHDYVENQRADK